MNLKTGDKVVVITGKDKGKQGKIIKTLRAENKVIVEGINMIKKHVKPNGQNAGSIVDMEAPINKGTRVGHSTDKKGKKIRIARKSNENLD